MNLLEDEDFYQEDFSKNMRVKQKLSLNDQKNLLLFLITVSYKVSPTLWLHFNYSPNVVFLCYDPFNREEEIDV